MKIIRPHTYHSKNAGTRSGRKGTTPVDNLHQHGWSPSAKKAFNEGYDLINKIAAQAFEDLLLEKQQQYEAQGLSPKEARDRAVDEINAQGNLGSVSLSADAADKRNTNAGLGAATDTALTALKPFIGQTAATLGNVAGNIAANTDTLDSVWDKIHGTNSGPQKAFEAGEKAQDLTPEQRAALYKRGRGDATLGDVGGQLANTYGMMNAGADHIDGATKLVGGLGGLGLGYSTGKDIAENTGLSPTQSKVVGAATGVGTGYGAMRAASALDNVLAKAPGSIIPRTITAPTRLGQTWQSISNPIKDLVLPKAVSTPAGPKVLSGIASRILPSARLGMRALGPVSGMLSAANGLRQAANGESLSAINQAGADRLLNGDPSNTSRVADTAVKALSLDINGATQQALTDLAVRGRGDENIARSVRQTAADSLVNNAQDPSLEYARAYYHKAFGPENFSSPEEHARATEYMAQNAARKAFIEHSRSGLASAAGDAQPLPNTRHSMLDKRIANGELGNDTNYTSTLGELGKQMGAPAVQSPNGGLGSNWLGAVQKATQVPGFKLPSYTPPAEATPDFSRLHR